MGRLLTERSQVIEAGPGEGEHQRLAHLWKPRRDQVCFDLSCVLIAGSHISASGQCKNTYTMIKFEPACFQASYIAMGSLNMSNRSYVLLDVNPGSIVAPLKLFDDMPYSGIERTSKRAAFAPFLSLLLLIEKFKLQPCELLLRLDIRLFNEQ